VGRRWRLPGHRQGGSPHQHLEARHPQPPGVQGHVGLRPRDPRHVRQDGPRACRSGGGAPLSGEQDGNTEGKISFEDLLKVLSPTLEEFAEEAEHDLEISIIGSHIISHLPVLVENAEGNLVGPAEWHLKFAGIDDPMERAVWQAALDLSRSIEGIRQIVREERGQ